MLSLLILSCFQVSGEGTKQLLPDSTVSGAGLFIDNSSAGVYTRFAMVNCAANNRLYIHAKSAGEKILFGLSTPYSPLVYNLRKPNGSIAMTGTLNYTIGSPGYIYYYHEAMVGPFPQQGGYVPLEYTVTSIADTGNYYFEIASSYPFQYIIEYWDFQVVSGQHTPSVPADTINGRVWSQSWQLYAYLAGPFQPFNGKFFIYSDDGIVTRLGFSNAHVGAVTIFCNTYGCLNTGNFTTDRQSKNTNTFTSFPAIAQYKVFLNNPDPTVYPSGIIGQIIPTPYLIPDPGYPVCSGRKYIVVNVNKAGKLEIAISFPYGAPATNVSLYADVISGVNNIPWNGKDGQGNMAPDGTLISFGLKLLNGLTNLPIWDQEQNPNGYDITLIRPVSPGMQIPLTFWDDTQLTPGTYLGDPCTNPPQSFNLTGCTPGSIPGYAGCHPWAPTGPDCHNKMINTWWYGSTATTTFTAIFTQTPPNPTGHGDSHCGPGILNLHATILPPTETVDWYSVSIGGTPLIVGDTNFTTPLITGTTTYYAQARSVLSGCLSSSRIPVVAIINPIPQPTLSGPDSVCAGTSGNTYTTQPGMASYIWSISTGGIITSGSGTNTIIVTWNVPGIQSLSVSCVSTAGCASLTPGILSVLVNPIPVPTLTGPLTVCINTTSLYTTQAGMVNYIWNVVTGGTITSGGTSSSNTIVILWNSAGNRTVSVSYTSPAGCPAAAPAIVNVNVNPLPAPTITGPSSLCLNTTGVYITQPGMTGYNWTVSAGGTITSGTGTNSITVNWTITSSQNVSVTYSNSFGCIPASPTVFNVTVNPLPVPTINGTSSLCLMAGGVYTTQPGMSGYIWSVSAGGIILSGAGTNSITVKWTIIGPQSVSVNYTNVFGCTAVNPAVFTVMVNPLPIPTLMGPVSVCKNSSGNVYTTQPGMTGYTWSVSSGGVITGGGTATNNTITITWTTTGYQTVIVNYSSQFGCPGVSPALINVLVNPLPVPTLSGPVAVCLNSDAGYTTQSGMNNYSWSVSSGGIILTGSGTDSIMVHWNTTGNQIVSVTYTDFNGCNPASPALLNVTVHPLPVAFISGPTPVCLYSTGNTYYTQPGMNNYHWTVSSGGAVTAGGTSTSDSITVIWNATGFQSIMVTYNDSFGCHTAEPAIYFIQVNPLPVASIYGPSPVCIYSKENTYFTQSGMNNYNWIVSTGGTITAGGTPTSDSVAITWNVTGNQSVQVSYNNSFGCHTEEPAFDTILVNPLPVPVISGADKLCEGITGVAYTTQPGMIDYEWSISSGGTITSGAETDTIYVTWNSPGTQYVTVIYTSPQGCKAKKPDTMIVTIRPKPGQAGPINGVNPVCAPVDGIVYSISPVPNTSGYVWTIPTGVTLVSGQGSNSITVNFDSGATSGIFNVYAMNDCGDGALSPPFEVTVNHPPTASAGTDGSICAGESYTVSHATATNYSGLLWSSTGSGSLSGEHTLTPTYSPATIDSGTIILTLIATGNPPCRNDTASMHLIIIAHPIVSAGSDKLTCERNPVTIDGSSALHYSSLSWHTSGDGIFNDPSILHPQYTPGTEDISQGNVTLLLIVTPIEPCQVDSDTLALTIEKQAAIYAGADASICPEQQYIPLDATLTNGTTPLWNTTGDGVFSNPFVLHPLFTPGNSDMIHGFAMLILSSGSSLPCTAVADTMRLDLPANPLADAGADQTVKEATPDTLTGKGTGGSGNYSYKWEPGSLLIDPDQQNAVTLPMNKDTVFILTVTDLMTGCSSTDSVRIHLEYSPPPTPDEGCIVIHNVITPNGNGLNDTWIIDCITNYPDNTVEIFNRWGDPVNRFERYDNSTNVWKGTNFKGNMMPDGTYYYVLKIRNVISRSGWVYLRGGR